jgi:hypothetical protein
MTESEQPAQQPGPIADPPPAPSADVPRQPSAGPAATQAQPSGTPPYGPVPPQFGAPPYGAPAGYPPPYAYGYGYAPPQQGGTNGMAIAAMVCGICGFACLVPGLVGIVLGIIALPQIKRSGQAGRGMAITGIVMGALWIVVFVLLIVLGHISNGGQVSVGNSG